jgi:predicted PurR-regulated permease PerM
MNMNKVLKTFHSGRAVFFLMVFICIIFTAAVLKIASTVILPFTIAALLAFVMYPLIKAMEKIHCPLFLSILLVVFIIITGMYIFGVVLFSSGRMIITHFPNYESRFTEIYNWVAQLLDLPNDEDLSFWQNLWGQERIRSFVRSFTFSFSNLSLKFISSAVLVVLFMVFLLLEASFFKEKLEIAFENRIDRINRMGSDIISQVTRYLAAKFLISLANGIVLAICLSFAKLEFAIVWGVIQFVMNFIPTLGSILVGILISFFALLQFWPEPGPVILVIAIALGTNMITYVLDPKIIGDNMRISPLVVIASVAIWGYIWGFAGMVLSVPMMVIIKIVCENIPIMEPFSILIGSKRSIHARKAEDEKAETNS